MGAENSLSGRCQADGLGTHQGRLTLSHFGEPTWQLQVQLGRDLAVHTGVQEARRLNCQGDEGLLSGPCGTLRP